MSEKITKSARFTPREAEMIDRLAELRQFPDGVTSVLRDGLERVWKQYGWMAEENARNEAELAAQRTGEGMDPVARINQIRELAANIASNLGEGSADELVEYALSDEGRESWGIDIELDAHDRRLLVRCVEDNLSDDA